MTKYLLAIVLLGCWLVLNESLAVHSNDINFSHYSRLAVGIELPKSVESLLLREIRAQKIVDLRALAYERRGKHDYLAVAVTLEVQKGSEALYHHSFVLKKDCTDKAWSGAKLYRTMHRIFDLFVLPDTEFREALVEIQ